MAPFGGGTAPIVEGERSLLSLITLRLGSIFRKAFDDLSFL